MTQSKSPRPLNTVKMENHKYDFEHPLMSKRELPNNYNRTHNNDMKGAKHS